MSRKAKALYDYDAAEDDELSIREDDMLEIISDDGAWATCKLNGQTGSVPLNYVEIIKTTKAPPPPPVKKRRSATTIRAVAEYDYDAADGDEVRAATIGACLPCTSQPPPPHPTQLPDVGCCHRRCLSGTATPSS